MGFFLALQRDDTELSVGFQNGGPYLPGVFDPRYPQIGEQFIDAHIRFIALISQSTSPRQVQSN